jgi:hypothetical protein
MSSPEMILAEGWVGLAAGLALGAVVVGAPGAPRRRAEIGAVQPPRWKQTVAIWLGFFPLSLLSNFFLAPLLVPAPITVRVLALTGLQTPVMTYLVLPRITAALSWWLHPRSQPAGEGAASTHRPSTASRAAPSPVPAVRAPA